MLCFAEIVNTDVSWSYYFDSSDKFKLWQLQKLNEQKIQLNEAKGKTLCDDRARYGKRRMAIPFDADHGEDAQVIGEKGNA